MNFYPPIFKNYFERIIKGMTDNYDVFAAMQTEPPLASFRKTILGKVHVNILDPFTDTPTAIILSGRPNDESASVSVWTEKQLAYFLKLNRYHLQRDILVRVSENEAPAKEKKEFFADATDEDIVLLVHEKWQGLDKKLNKITSVSMLERILKTAIKEERGEKIVGLITKRISDVQSGMEND